jgi:hypothetical protein
MALETTFETAPGLEAWLEAWMPRINEIARDRARALFGRVVGEEPSERAPPSYRVADLKGTD